MGFPWKEQSLLNYRIISPTPRTYPFLKKLRLYCMNMNIGACLHRSLKTNSGVSSPFFSYLKVGSSSFCCILTVWAVSFRAILFLTLICTLRSLSSVGINRYCHHSGDRRQRQGADMVEKPSTIEFIPSPVATLASVIYGGPTYGVCLSQGLITPTPLTSLSRAGIKG